jgi:hypothetical protein
MSPDNEETLEQILQQYGQSFSSKVFESESTQEDDLMLVFGLTQIMKAENKQYWGRELGMCWQRLVTEVCRQTRQDFGPGIREGSDEICDLVVGADAIDTKYRIGSGDSGTLKKFRHYGQRLTNLGFRPVLLILRTDNLPQAIGACIVGGWTVFAGSDAFLYLLNGTGFNLQTWLQARRDRYKSPPKPEKPTSGTL